MSKKIKKGLGKGMESLIGDYSKDFMDTDFDVNSTIIESTNNQEILNIPIEEILINPLQPRKNFNKESLDELSESIKSQGIIQPILVEKVSDKQYSIVAGERRYRAAELAGLKDVPVIVKNFTDIQRLEVALIENIQRENLNSIEEAQAYKYLINESGLTQDEVAKRVGKNRSTISNSMRLLQLGKKMKEALESGEISAGHARAYLSLTNPADKKILEKKLLNGSLSVRGAEKIATNLKKGKRNNPEKDSSANENNNNERVGIDSDLLAIQERFISAIGSRVEFKGDVNKGKFTISYNSIEELERLFQMVLPDGDLFEI